MNGAGKADLFGTPIIDHFRDEYRFLSNFYIAPVTVWDITFPTSEHAYQWAKTIVPDEQMAILECKTPGQVKRAGQNVTMRPDWESIRYGVMLEILYAKFTQHWGLKQKLLETGNSMLIEGNHWHDNIFGNCVCSKCEKIQGRNMLGCLLMEVRQNLLDKYNQCSSTSSPIQSTENNTLDKQSEPSKNDGSGTSGLVP